VQILLNAKESAGIFASRVQNLQELDKICPLKLLSRKA